MGIWGKLTASLCGLLALLDNGHARAAGGTPIEHIVIIIQEQRSFDHYFGTFPGADGIPMVNGIPSVCVNDPKTHNCVFPYHDPSLINTGGPVAYTAYPVDFDNGLMDGFIKAAEQGFPLWTKENCADPTVPSCTGDVMGYHTAAEIPNYWSYAQTYVLQDHMYGSSQSYGLPGHLFLLSGWSATCTWPDQPNSCTSNEMPPRQGSIFDDWTDITWLLNQSGVSWAYYMVANPKQPHGACGAHEEGQYTPGEWSPLPCFDDVSDDGQTANVMNNSYFYAAAAAGTLPAVSWIAPNFQNSEHQKYSVAAGETYVTGLINAVMNGPNWNSTAIFVVWADWGGYYDHEPPVQVDGVGYGFRVPGLLISPWAIPGYIDHQVLSFDAYNKFIEDIFLGGQRLDPATDGRPDPRPDVRENEPQLGDLMAEFDFTQKPRAPLVLQPK